MEQPVVILVHGYSKRGVSMSYLAKKLTGLGYATFTPTLPSFFANVPECGRKLSFFLKKHLSEYGGVMHFVGHSMGGLVIRHYIAFNQVLNPGRVVLIGTPNKGILPRRQLVNLIPFSRVFSPALGDMAEPGMRILPPLNFPPPHIGVIAGTNPGPLGSKSLSGPRNENDGLVTVDSARLPGAGDEILLPHDHEHIHRRPETARLVDRFLRTGHFLPPSSQPSSQKIHYSSSE